MTDPSRRHPAARQHAAPAIRPGLSPGAQGRGTIGRDSGSGVPAAPLPSPGRVRLAVRAIILVEGRLLLVNAYPEGQSDLWCAPGGGVEPGLSLPDNLVREVREETGLVVHVGVPCLINEFHDPQQGFHQCDIYFRAQVAGGTLDPAWRDPAGVVSHRRLVSRDDMTALRFKPDTLAQVAWDEDTHLPLYDPLELLVR